ncbi:MAG TPA: ferredoxin, partial [Sarcina sp.]|nr:ferredoxin [Sarcina sp.]
MKKMINLKINDVPVTVPEGTSVLQAARYANVDIPSLCYLKDINCIGACRVCVVEIKGRKGLTAACTYPVEEGLEVLTNTAMVRNSRRTTLELLISAHRRKCLSCGRSDSCELQALGFEYGANEDHFKGEDPNYPIDDS